MKDRGRRLTKAEKLKVMMQKVHSLGPAYGCDFSQYYCWTNYRGNARKSRAKSSVTPPAPAS